MWTIFCVGLLEKKGAHGQCTLHWGMSCDSETLWRLQLSTLSAVVYKGDYRPEVNLFNPPSFAGFHKVLDGEIKCLRSTGLGVSVKQAEPITGNEENQL